MKQNELEGAEGMDGEGLVGTIGPDTTLEPGRVGPVEEQAPAAPAEAADQASGETPAGEAGPAQDVSQVVTVALRFNLETKAFGMVTDPPDLRANRDFMHAILGMAHEKIVVDAVMNQLAAMQTKEPPKQRIVSPHDVIPPRGRRR
jgi:hypothetical protein